MKVIFLKDLYGQNFLIKKGYAILATPANVKKLEHDMSEQQLEENDTFLISSIVTLPSHHNIFY